ncbi:MAG: RNA-binding domain-containing protein [Candidatus Bathyarchaeia archaeon]
MSSKIPVGYIDIRVFAHATEDPDKVLMAVRNVLPTELAENIAFKKTSLTGHYGNPILLFETRIKDKKFFQAAFEKLSAGLNALDRETLSNEIERHVENGNLYIRLNKQSAYHGEVRLSNIDPIHLKIHFKKHGVKEIVEICRKLGLIR